MSKTKKAQVLLISLGLLLVVFIYLTPKNTPNEKEVEAPLNSALTDFSFAEYRSNSRNILSWEEGQRSDSLNSIIESASIEVFDSLAVVYDAINRPGVSAYYFETKASKDNKEKSYLNAAYRYFDAFKISKDSLESAYFVQKAIVNYRKVISINPDNLNAKTDLGVCLTEGTSQPMQGIQMLREVVEADPNHEYAQMNLGFLSVKSGQYEKAIERFRKVVEINPSRLDMYVYLGEAYAQIGDFDNAILNLQIFANLSGEAELVSEVESYIEKLKIERSESSK